MAAPRVTNQVLFPTYTVTAPGTAQNFDSVIIPDGFKTVFKNRLAATGNFYLGSSQSNAQSSATRKVLEPGESVTYEIGNLNVLWYDADDSTTKLDVTLLAPS